MMSVNPGDFNSLSIFEKEAVLFRYGVHLGECHCFGSHLSVFHVDSFHVEVWKRDKTGMPEAIMVIESKIWLELYLAKINQQELSNT